MLADAEHVQPDLVGQLDLLEQIGQPLVRCDVVGRQLRERVDPQLHASSVAEACGRKYSSAFSTSAVTGKPRPAAFSQELGGSCPRPS
jgi:xanthine/uracil permease